MQRPRLTSAGLRSRIDAGRAGDKVPGFDPSAAPLGTDAEAGGARAAEELLGRDFAGERAMRPRSDPPNAATPELAPDGEGPPTPFLAPALIGAGLAAALAVLFVTLL